MQQPPPGGRQPQQFMKGVPQPRRQNQPQYPGPVTPLPGMPSQAPHSAPMTPLPATPPHPPTMPPRPPAPMAQRPPTMPPRPVAPPQPPVAPMISPAPSAPTTPSKRALQVGMTGVIGIVLITLLVGVFIGYVIHGNGGTDAAAQTNNTGATDPSQSAPGSSNTSQHLTGEAVNVDNNTWQMTLSQAHLQLADNINQTQKAGNVYLMIDVSMKNISNKPQTVSSTIQFVLRTTDGAKIDVSPYISHDISDPSGTTNPGGLIQGTLVFEVAPDVTSYQVDFLSDQSVQQMAWDIHVTAIQVPPTPTPSATETDN